MFNREDEIHWEARLQSTGGQKAEVAVRWPSDEEWMAYLRQKRFIVRQLGRGVTQTVPPEAGEPDVDLYQKIALNGSPAMTPAEAGKALDTISQSKTLSVALEGAEAEVELRVVTGVVKHRMRIPTADQIALYNRSAVQRLDLPHNLQQAKFNQQVSARLYDECGGHSADYVGSVPMPHKHEVVWSVINEVELEYGPKPDDENF